MDAFKLMLRTITFWFLMIITDGKNCTDFRGKYISSVACIGKSGTDFIISSFSGLMAAQCAKKCQETYRCMLIFYNRKTRACTLHSGAVSDIAKTSNSDSSCYIADDVTESWIQEIINATYSISGFPATAMIGKKNSGHWHTSGNGDTLEFRIATEMYVEQIHIYELEGESGVNGISLRTDAGTWYPVWTTLNYGTVSGARVLSPELEKTHFKTQEVRITVGTKVQGIYAIKVMGKTHRKTASEVIET